MGTRADFYIGRGEHAEWLGSIAWDGYPEGIPQNIKEAVDANSFRLNVTDFLVAREDATLPEDGWPWPWNDSQTTDYAYAFDKGQVWASCFGYEWFNPDNEPKNHVGDKVVTFPNMKDKQKVTFGPRSGLIVITRR